MSRQILKAILVKNASAGRLGAGIGGAGPSMNKTQANPLADPAAMAGMAAPEKMPALPQLPQAVTQGENIPYQAIAKPAAPAYPAAPAGAPDPTDRLLAPAKPAKPSVGGIWAGKFQQANQRAAQRRSAGAPLPGQVRR